MMKRLLLLFVLLFLPVSVFANYNDIYIVDIKYDWINKSMVEKEAIVKEISDIVFEQSYDVQKDLKIQYKDKLKDKNHINNYFAASAGYKEIGEYNISAFYYKNMKNIYMYALQDKKDVSKAYYYDTLGHLRYIDFINGSYPEYPYFAAQYRISGKPISVIYYVSEDCQYLFKPTGEFEGVWYKHNLYNMDSKIILKRTSY